MVQSDCNVVPKELTVTVTSKLGCSEVVFHADDTGQSTSLSGKDFSDSSEWFLHEMMTYKVHNPHSKSDDSSNVVRVDQPETSKAPTGKPDGASSSKYEDRPRLLSDPDTHSSLPPADKEDKGDDGHLSGDPIEDLGTDEVLEVQVKASEEFQFPRPTVSITCKATRKPLFFVLNVNLFIVSTQC